MSGTKRPSRREKLGRELLGAVVVATGAPVKATWDERTTAAVVLLCPGCTEQEARDALRPTLNFYGLAEFGESEGTGDDTNFYAGAVDMAARRWRAARATARWESEQNEQLAKKASHLRAVAGGKS